MPICAVASTLIEKCAVAPSAVVSCAVAFSAVASCTVAPGSPKKANGRGFSHSLLTTQRVVYT